MGESFINFAQRMVKNFAVNSKTIGIKKTSVTETEVAPDFCFPMSHYNAVSMLIDRLL